jgi:hypothetical protein
VNETDLLEYKKKGYPVCQIIGLGVSFLMFDYKIIPERRGQKESGEAKRSPLSPDFSLIKRDKRNLGITVIGRLFCHCSGKV